MVSIFDMFSGEDMVSSVGDSSFGDGEMPPQQVVESAQAQSNDDANSQIDETQVNGQGHLQRVEVPQFEAPSKSIYVPVNVNVVLPIHYVFPEGYVPGWRDFFPVSCVIARQKLSRGHTFYTVSGARNNFLVLKF
jgi:hypothetical protein